MRSWASGDSSGPGAARGSPAAAIEIEDLEAGARELAVPVIRDGFVGIYRWHAKRTLREVPRVRAARSVGEIVGVSLLDRLAPEIGYVYYIIVRQAYRGKGIGGLLCDDALLRYRAEGVEVVYAAVQTDNVPSLRLFARRGFRPVERKERGWAEGGLGAWGLRSRMRLVPGERLLGLRLQAPLRSPATGATREAVG